jgi:predicted RNA binding protein YcfA (HicA-like mRNA interferase family)
MRAIPGKEFARMVERRGSHHIYGKTGSIVRLTIPIHGNRPLKTGLLRHLSKLAEIPEEELR